MLILQLAIILIAAKIGGHISVRLGQPSVLGQLIAGILIGPGVFGLVENSDIIHELSNIGVIILMFIAGLKRILSSLEKARKRLHWLAVWASSFRWPAAICSVRCWA